MPGTPIHPEKDEDTEVVPLAPTPPDEPKGSRTRPAELTHLHPDDAGTMDGGKPVGEPLSPSPKSREESGAPRKAELQQVPMCGSGTAWGCCGQYKDDPKVWFIHPEGKFRKTWDTFQAVLLIYVAISVPVRIGFNINNEYYSGEWFLELFVDAYFWCDILFNFRTGFFSNDGVVVSDRKKIRQAYFKGWFTIDAVSCFPASYIVMIVADADATGTAGNVKGLRMMRMLRLTKMLRLGRLKRIFQRYAEQMQPYMKGLKLAGMVVVAFFLAHLLACLWYGVGGEVDYLTDGSVVTGWVHNYNWGLGCLEADPQADPDDPDHDVWLAAGAGANLTGDCVLADVDVASVDLSTRYRVSLYWAVTTLTTIGYGDITPVTSTEMKIGMVSMALGGFLFGMLVGTLSSQITAGNIADQEYHRQMETIREFLRGKNVPVNTRRKIMAFYNNYFQSKTVFEEGKILAKLPDSMRVDVMKQMYNELMEPVPFFSRPNPLPDECIYKVRPPALLPLLSLSLSLLAARQPETPADQCGGSSTAVHRDAATLGHAERRHLQGGRGGAGHVHRRARRRGGVQERGVRAASDEGDGGFFW